MHKYYFTFGSNHETKQGYSLGRNYVMIEAVSEMFARQKMYDARTDKWAFSYTEKEFAGQPEKYGLTSLTLEQVTL